MKSVNYPEINHPVGLSINNDKIIVTYDGNNVAELTVYTMEKDVIDKNTKNGFKVVPTEGFWVQFRPLKSYREGGCPDCACIYEK